MKRLFFQPRLFSTNILLPLMLVCFLHFFMAPAKLGAQTTGYLLKKPAELTISGVGLLHSLGNYRLRSRSIALRQLPPSPSLAPPDRWFTYSYRPTVSRFSDVAAAATAALPLGFFLSGNTKGNRVVPMVVMTEAMWMTWNLTESLKHAAKRNRPLVYISNTPDEKRFTKDARLSFPSGHTSMSFCIATSLHFALKQYDFTLNQRRWLAGSAWLLATGTASMRVIAGKHYPSDVLAGAAIGFGTALLMHHIHVPR